MLTFFCALNSLIALWEIGLGLHIDNIYSEYKKIQEKCRGNNLLAVQEFMFYDMNLYEMVSFKFWGKVWSTYSLYDPSYSNKESFGFFVDVGNGWSTLIPSVLFIINMTYDNFPARTMGIIAILKFYQEFYGTVIYFTSFIFNKRYKNKNIIEVACFVGISNGLWIFFPLSIKIYLKFTTRYVLCRKARYRLLEDIIANTKLKQNTLEHAYRKVKISIKIMRWDTQCSSTVFIAV
eukprot:gene2005-3899_t